MFTAGPNVASSITHNFYWREIMVATDLIFVVLFFVTAAITAKYLINQSFYGELKEAVVGLCLGALLTITALLVFVEIHLADG